MLKGFKGKYETGKELGSGSFATVVEALNKDDKKSYAIKCIKKENLSEDDEVDLMNEIDILQSINHPNIIRLYEVYNEADTYYLVTELLQGGELFDRIVAREAYTEKDARDVSKILLTAIDFCHKKKIVHRDLKPENLLLLHENTDSEIKLADFGFAKRLSGQFSLRTQCGSPSYVAPEILRGRFYGTKVDMWSIGIILYVLLCGYLPFTGSKPEIMYRRVVRGDYSFDEEDWAGVTDDAKNLINCLLQIDPLKRINSDDALSHPWITYNAARLSKIDRSGSLRKLQEFQALKKFQNSVNVVVAFNNFGLNLQAKSMRVLNDPLKGIMKDKMQTPLNATPE